MLALHLQSISQFTIGFDLLWFSQQAGKISEAAIILTFKTLAKSRSHSKMMDSIWTKSSYNKFNFPCITEIISNALHLILPSWVTFPSFLCLYPSINLSFPIPLPLRHLFSWVSECLICHILLFSHTGRKRTLNWKREPPTLSENRWADVRENSKS